MIVVEKKGYNLLKQGFTVGQKSKRNPLSTKMILKQLKLSIVKPLLQIANLSTLY